MYYTKYLKYKKKYFYLKKIIQQKAGDKIEPHIPPNPIPTKPNFELVSTTKYRVNDIVIFTADNTFPYDRSFNGPRGDSGTKKMLEPGKSYRAKVIRSEPRGNGVIENYSLELLDEPRGFIPQTTLPSISKIKSD